MLLLKTILLTAAAIEVADLDRAAQELQNENMILKKRVSNLKLAKENKELLAEIEALELESSKVMKTEDTTKASACWEKLKVYDTNGDGSFDAKEWAAIFDKLNKPGGDDVLDADELGACTCFLYLEQLVGNKDGEINKKEWGDMWKTLDADNSGSVDKIEIGAVCGANPCWDMLIAYDADGNGKLEPPEWAKIHADLDKKGNNNGKVDKGELGECDCIVDFATREKIDDGDGELELSEWNAVYEKLDGGPDGDKELTRMELKTCL